MSVSIEKLRAEAEATGFRVDVLARVVRLMSVLRGVRDHPFLKGRLALKGGTALNLFVFDVPRLSVDIDLNYVGADSRDGMLEERPGVERALTAVFSRENLSVRRAPEGHAGGKWRLRYQDPSGRSGTLEVDVNYMYRVPLWPIGTMDSCRLGSWGVRRIPVVDFHELVAGKLCALLSRNRARDLYDSRLALSLGIPGARFDAPGEAVSHDSCRGLLDPELLRIAFVVQGAAARRDWRTVSIEDVEFEVRELAGQLLPALRRRPAAGVGVAEYGRRLVDDCRNLLSAVLPLREREVTFLDLLLDRGIVDGSILTGDEGLAGRIRAQPLLRWKARNVRSRRGRS
ncbi:MAG: nucleotidyl transferase AbiEii/AbiGii toxin family protein [Gemmatimonadota bacterium]|nr:nucleotidyl transferase AbiEii/AbiGii toxin family protein [Gemmatimonadota bacterium]MDE2983544.1 nucleotidyl transferase AbiEii/AbiGii toxin family protein [Gemmatimonadota bacterium]